MSLSRKSAKISIGLQEESVPVSKWLKKEKDFVPGNCTSSVGSSQVGISLAEPAQKEEQNQFGIMSGTVFTTQQRQISSTSINSPVSDPITGQLSSKTN